MTSRHRLLLQISVFLSYSSAVGQIPGADSLLRQLTRVEDTIKVNVLNQLSRHYRFVDAGKTLTYAREALRLAGKLRFKPGLARANSNLGVAYYLRNDYPRALTYYGEAVKADRERGNRQEVGNALNNMGLVYWKQGDYPKAIDHYLQSLAIDEERHDEKGVAMSLDNIGNIYQEQGDYRMALHYYQRALKLAGKFADDKILSATVLNNIGSTYLLRLDYTQALHYLLQSLNSRPDSDLEGKGVCLSNIGLTYLGMKQYGPALDYLTRALDLQQQLGDEDDLLSTLEGLATTYRQTGDFAKSEASARRSLELAEKMGDKKRTASACLLLAEAAARRGQYQPAYRYHQRYSQVRDSLLNDENTRRTARLVAGYETQRKETEIRLLQEEKTQDRLVKNLFGLGLFSSVAIGGLLLFRQRTTNRKNEEILQTRQLLAETELRNRLDREAQLQQELDFRNKALTTYTLNLIQKNGILEEIRELSTLALKSYKSDEQSPLFGRLIKLIDYSFSQDKDWDEFKVYFESVHKDFFTKLKALHGDLGTGDLRLCALIRLNLNLKESANLLSISPDSVKTARHRLRKKLNLPGDYSLTDYLMTI